MSLVDEYYTGGRVITIQEHVQPVFESAIRPLVALSVYTLWTTDTYTTVTIVNHCMFYLFLKIF